MYDNVDTLIIEYESSKYKNHPNEKIPDMFSLEPQCPKGFVDIDPSQTHPFCFKIMPESTSWQESNLECRRQGAILATILTTVENNYMMEFLHQTGINFSWIGLSKSGKIPSSFILQ